MDKLLEQGNIQVFFFFFLRSVTRRISKMLSGGWSLWITKYTHNGYPILKFGDKTRRVSSFIEDETRRVSVCYMGNERFAYLLPGSLGGQNIPCYISMHMRRLVSN